MADGYGYKIKTISVNAKLIFRFFLAIDRENINFSARLAAGDENAAGVPHH